MGDPKAEAEIERIERIFADANFKVEEILEYVDPEDFVSLNINYNISGKKAFEEHLHRALALMPKFTNEILKLKVCTPAVIMASRSPTRFLSDALDPRTRQPSFFVLDLGVGFGNLNQGWTVQLRVENLTDEATDSTAEEVALATGVIAKGTNPPRVMIGEFRWEF